MLPLPEELTPLRDQISAQIGDNVRNAIVGSHNVQTIYEGPITFISGTPETLPLFVNVPGLPPNFLGRAQLIDQTDNSPSTHSG